MITENQIASGLLKAELKDQVMYTLLRKHRHQTKKSNLRSLADIGKTVSSASRLFTNPDNGNIWAVMWHLLLFIFSFEYYFVRNKDQELYKTALSSLYIGQERMIICEYHKT